MEVLTPYQSKRIENMQSCWFCNDNQLYITGFCNNCFHERYLIPRRQKNNRLREKWATLIKKKYMYNNN